MHVVFPARARTAFRELHAALARQYPGWGLEVCSVDERTEGSFTFSVTLAFRTNWSSGIRACSITVKLNREIDGVWVVESVWEGDRRLT